MAIRDLPERIRLTQLAEEAVELAHAALKLARILEGVNPSPMNENEARSKLLEEAADVMVCLDALIAPGDMQELNRRMDDKRRRWEERLGGTHAEHATDQA